MEDIMDKENTMNKYFCENCNEELYVIEPDCESPGLVTPCMNCMRKFYMDAITIQGNNGGDFVTIEKVKTHENGDNLIYIESGHCCVYSIKHTIPTELLSLIINNAMLGKKPEDIINESNWNEDFKRHLIEEISK